MKATKTCFTAITILLTSFTMVLNSQTPSDIDIYVRDAVTSLPIEGATVIMNVTSPVVQTDVFPNATDATGHFRVSNGWRGTMTVEYAGYVSQTQSVVESTTLLNFPLQPIDLPNVTTWGPEAIGSTFAIFGGDVTDEGSSPVTSAGVCWDTNPDPDINDFVNEESSGLGPFYSDLTGLEPLTTYYVRAYATSSAGTSYGSQTIFTTTCPVINIESTITDVDCYGNSTGEIDLTVSGGTGPYTFAWEHGPVEEDIGGLPAGTYTVTATDQNLCNGTASFTVNEPDVLEVSATNISNQTCRDCLDGAIEIEVTGGTPGYDFLWTLPGGSNSSDQNLSGLVAGSYDINVADVNGCDISMTWEVDLSLTVTNTEDEGPGSLRNALDDAIALDGTDQISFNIQGSGSHVIRPQSELVVSSPIHLDGYTQPGSVQAAGNNAATLMIVIDGIDLNENPFASGLKIEATSGCIIRGLAINNFGDAGIHIEGGGNHIITGNHIGVDEVGITPQANNDDGIRIINSSNNIIGQDSTHFRNIISGNGDMGIEIQGSGSTGNSIEGNWIGTIALNASDGNGSHGIFINAPNNYIGGTTEGSGNVISGNWGSGISLTSAGATGNQIRRNYIGTGFNGFQSNPNTENGITIDQGASYNVVGAGNIISGNQHTGVVITDAGTIGNEILGNFIGISEYDEGDVLRRIPNLEEGIQVGNGASETLIGPNNVISGNTLAAIYINNSAPSVAGEDNNRIFDNYIGTDPTGNYLLINGDDGVNIFNSSNNIIEGNVLCGAGAEEGFTPNNGVEIYGPLTFENVVRNNLIGTNANNDYGMGNAFQGVQIKRDAHHNFIGPNNVISGNAGNGILIEGEEGTSADNNEIFDNFIGTNSTGTDIVPNVTCGIMIQDHAANNVIGPGNVIAGNIAQEIIIEGAGSTGNVVSDNYIGTNATGDAPLSGFNNTAVLIAGAPENTIGPGNVISGAHNGITITWGIAENNPENGTGNEIKGNLIGTKANGLEAIDDAFQSFSGVEIHNAVGNTIGGLTEEDRNIISGHEYGIILGYNGRENTVIGNYIGTDKNGLAAIGNDEGVRIGDGTTGNIIGGGSPESANVISGNLGNGISIVEESHLNKVQGNLIGLQANGSGILGNGSMGIEINQSHENIIGGTPVERNIIGGNTIHGVYLTGVSTYDNHVIGNYIGTDMEGDQPVPNGQGVNIDDQASQNYIGGNTQGTGNLIAHNDGAGIGLGSHDDYVMGNHVFGNGTDGIFITGNNHVIGGATVTQRNYIYGNVNGISLFPGVSHNRIEGNFVGTDQRGEEDLTEGWDGIAIGGSDNEVINNLIVGYHHQGILLMRWDSEEDPNPNPVPVRNLIEGNRIGINAYGTGYIPNGHGISLNSATDNIIIRNTIAGNTFNGILMGYDLSVISVNNLISENNIFDNGELGIDLESGSFTENDNLDQDDGPNNLQNFPVLESVGFTPEEVVISGSLNSMENAEYTIEFFSNLVGDNAQYGEGQTYLGSTIVNTDGSGNATFAQSLPVEWYSGQVITATASDADGNTSEFSQAIGGATNQILAGIGQPFTYWINNEDVSIIPYSEVESAITSAYQTWDNVPTANIQFDFGGPTDARYASASDGVNLVSFKDDRFPFAPGVLAVTAKTLRMIPGTNEAEILDADIVFNPQYKNNEATPFAVLEEGDMESESFDIQGVATHEIGHQLGMIHSGVGNAVMFFMLGYGTYGRYLTPDDIAWLSHRYQMPDHGNLFRYISGNVTYGDIILSENPETHPPVAGALVLAAEAINSPDQKIIHAYTDESGHYSIPIPINEVSVEEFWVRIEPLDGDVWETPLTPANISPYIYANTVFTDFPVEFYDENESATDDPLDYVAISVLDEIQDNHVDLITNRDITPPTLGEVRVKYDDTYTDVSVNPTISAKFSEAVDINSFTETTCFFEVDGGGEVPGATYSYFDNKKDVILISPSSALKYSSSYSIYIGLITDLKGNELENPSATGFSTEIPDTEPPYVLDVIPQNGETQVSVTSSVRVFFNEPMDDLSVENGFTLTDQNGAPVEGEPEWDHETKVLEYVPDQSLSEGTVYTVTLAAGIKDRSDRGMLEEEEYSFTTVLVAPPGLRYLGPENDPNNLNAISVETPVLAEFTEPINPNTINLITFSLEGPDGQVDGEFEFLEENRAVVFWPNQTLTYDQDYTITLTDGIRDVSQPSQSFEGRLHTFHTATEDIYPVIEYLDPPSGVSGAEITISGSGFSPVKQDNQVLFNTLEAVVTEARLEYLTVRVPYGVVDGPVSVSVSGSDPSNTIDFDVIDPNTDPEYDWGVTSKAGSNTRSVAIPPDAGYAYATNWGGGTVSVLDLSEDTPAWVEDINVGNAPAVIDINPEGTRAYVTNYMSNTVSVINIDPNDAEYDFNTVINTIPVGDHPYGIAVSSDKKVYVANNASEYLSVIDVDTESGAFDHVVYNTKTGTNNRNVVVTPDAGLVLVTGLNGVNIIDRNQLSASFNQVIARAGSGSSTRHVAVTPDAALAIATTDLGEILFIDIFQPPGFQFGSVIASTRTGSSPRNINVSADAAYVYITNPEDNTVSVYKLDYSIIPGYGTSFDPGSGLKLIATISGLDAPYAIISDPASEFLLVTHDTEVGGVTKINIIEKSIDPIHSLGDLMESVQNALHNQVVERKIGLRLYQDLLGTLERLQDEDYNPAIDQLDNFIRRVDRYIKIGDVPDKLGQAWIDAAIRIRDELVKYAKGNKDFKGAADTDKVEITDNYSNQSLNTQITADLLGKQDLILQQNQPNPFSHQTMIYFEVPSSFAEQIPIMMRVYNTNGQVVKNLVNMEMKPGRYSVIWNGEMDDGGQVPEGLYLLELRTTDQRKVITLSVTK